MKAKRKLTSFYISIIEMSYQNKQQSFLCDYTQKKQFQILIVRNPVFKDCLCMTDQVGLNLLPQLKYRRHYLGDKPIRQKVICSMQTTFRKVKKSRFLFIFVLLSDVM